MARPSDQPLDAFFQRSESTYIRISLGVVGGLCLFIALCWGGHRVYVRWQEHKLMRQAHVAFEESKFRGAAMAAQQDDAKRQRVEPEDRDYEALLTRLWAELHPASGPVRGSFA